MFRSFRHVMYVVFVTSWTHWYTKQRTILFCERASERDTIWGRHE